MNQQGGGATVRFVELNHVLQDGMEVFPGLPRPKIGAWLDHEASRSHYNDQAQFYLGRVDMPCNIGTYLDSPFHRYANAADLSQVRLERVAGVPGIVLDALLASDRSITVAAEEAVLGGHAVLIRTGWDQRWGTERYWEPSPYLAGTTLEFMIHAKPVLVGVDCWNVDNVEDLSRPAHTRLLGADILVVEHLSNLSALPRDGFRFFAVPLRIVRGASFPVRAFAEIPN